MGKKKKRHTPKQAPASGTMALQESAAVTRTVKIKATGGITLSGVNRKLGDPVPGGGIAGPTWTFPSLASGSYIFNVDIQAVAGSTVSFAFEGGTATTSAVFLIDGTPGQVNEVNRDIHYKVA